MEVCGSLPTNVNEEILPYFLFSANFSVLLLPFVIIFSLPKKFWRQQWRKIKVPIQKHPNVVHPN